MKLSERMKEDPKKYFLIFLLIVLYCGPFTFIIFDIAEISDKKNIEIERIKNQCTMVHKTIDARTQTSIYSCPPDDTKYEFTERL